jgi:hypothetical protein
MNLKILSQYNSELMSIYCMIIGGIVEMTSIKKYDFK